MEKQQMIKGGYYIKARKIQESRIAHASPVVREIWDWLLMQANHKDTNVCKRGETIRSYKDIQEGLSWYAGWRKMTYSKSDCENAMKWLRNATMITTQKTTIGLIINIVNYDLYQTPENYESHNEKHTTTTRKPQTSHTINKNDKNDKKINNTKYDTWKLVQQSALVQADDLVQTRYQPSAVEAPNLVQAPEHTKERQKKDTKESSGVPPQDIQTFIELFKTVNPSYKILFGNKTERKCSARLLLQYGLEKMKTMFITLPDILGQPYAPRISTPYELEKNLGKLLQFIQQSQNKIINKKPIVLI
jgi:hypothetical protein